MFDRYADSGAYHWRETDRWSREYNPPLVARYRILLDAVEPGDVLDAGCGDGYLSAQLAEICEAVLSLEYEEAGIHTAAMMLADVPVVSLLRGDTGQLPLATGSISQVVMADVIEHLPHAETAVREVARVLKPGGRFLLTTPIWQPDRPIGPYHVKEYLPEEMRDMLSVDFERVEFRFFWPLSWSARYRTRVGWRLLKMLGRFGFNPFMTSSDKAEGFGQMLAIATGPREP